MQVYFVMTHACHGIEAVRIPLVNCIVHTCLFRERYDPFYGNVVATI